MTENDINADLMIELEKSKKIIKGQSYSLKLAVEALSQVVIYQLKNQKENVWTR
jgi:hypothetical protein